MPNSLRFKNKVAVVTGAGSGIGRATALLLAREGAAVVAGVHKSSDAAPLEEKAQGLPGKLAGAQIDVTRDADAQRLIGTAVERFGGLNILVNNAGIVISGTVTEATDEDLQRLLDVNLKGVFLCCKYGVQEMLKRGGGSIVNNSSINGLRGNHRLAGVWCFQRGGGLPDAGDGSRPCSAEYTGELCLPGVHRRYTHAGFPYCRLAGRAADAGVLAG